MVLFLLNLIEINVINLIDDTLEKKNACTVKFKAFTLMLLFEEENGVLLGLVVILLKKINQICSSKS